MVKNSLKRKWYILRWRNKQTWGRKYLCSKALKKHISGLGNVSVHNTLMRTVVTGFFTLAGRDNDIVHLLLGQPNKMMHDPACKLFLHRSAKAWLPALNWSALQRCRRIIPDVYSQSSSLHRDWLRHILTVSHSSRLHQTQWATVVFHDLHHESKAQGFPCWNRH